jgi:two-component sensor histidine kinase
MFGIFLDVTGRKQAEEGHELLAGEMSHRVKNLLLIASGLTAITSRSTKTTTDMARELTQRLTALGRAHDLVRPLPGSEGKAALLGDLIAVLLAPYDDLGAFSGRVRVAVPRMGVGEKSATTLALIVHELATNSLKYGALSSATGTLDVSCSIDQDEVVLVWTERGGPNVVAPDTAGYGSKLVSRALESELSGTGRVVTVSNLLVQLIRLRAQRDVKYSESLSDILIALAGGAPATASRGTAQPSPRTQAMLNRQVYAWAARIIPLAPKQPYLKRAKRADSQ